MSSSKDTRPAATANDEYGWIDRYAADLHRSAKELVAKGEAARVSDEALAHAAGGLWSDGDIDVAVLLLELRLA